MQDLLVHVKAAIIVAYAFSFFGCPGPAPRPVELKDLDAACKHETKRLYAKISGYVIDKGFYCSDRPGGIHCDLTIGETPTGGNAVPVKAKAFFSVDAPKAVNAVLIRQPYPANASDPVTVPLDQLEIYTGGRLLNIAAEPVVLSGSLQTDKETGTCYQLVLNIDAADE